MPETETIEEPEARPNSQNRIDGMTKEKARQEFGEAATEYAELDQKWKDARELREVRLTDLVNAHDHEISDRDRSSVSKAAAKAVKRDRAALAQRQEAKEAVLAAHKLMKSFDEHEAPVPLIDEPEPEESAPKPAEEAKPKKRSHKKKK